MLFRSRYSEGLHQAIEAKEHIKVAQRNRTMATVTFQNFFRMYDKLSGMTGTADTEAVEFNKIYNIDVVVIPTNKPVARIDENDVVYLNEKEKFEALCNEIQEAHKRGQPVLVGTVSIEKSELISSLLTKKGVKHEVLNAKNHAREALIIAEAGSKGSVTIATNMAGRGTDIKLGGNPEFRARRRVGTEASPEEYAKAYEIEYEKWQKDYEEVKSLGGLYVIGTERHESRRIDNQLRGRSGRQGDPGRSKFFISMDDDLMRLFGGENIKAMMSRMGMEAGEPIYHPWLNKSIEKAQKKVEERNFEIRKHLLEFDDVLNEQRNFIYSQRDSILKDENLIERILATAEEYISELLAEYNQDARHNFDIAAKTLISELKSNFGYELEIDSLNHGKTSSESLLDTILTFLKTDLNNKATLIGAQYFNLFIKDQYLGAIDRKWLDHLEALESLREAVYLRSYAQKNPLTEYKIEGFEIFDQMIDSIRMEIAKRMFLIKVKTGAEANNRPARKITTGNAQHSSISTFASGKSYGSPMQAGAQGDKVTVVRSTPKVGRNDSCPCGSGKKYKQCCGR